MRLMNIHPAPLAAGICENPACPAEEAPAVAYVRTRGRYYGEDPRRDLCADCLEAHTDHERMLAAAIVRAVRIGSEAEGSTAEAEHDRADRYRQARDLVCQLAGRPHCELIEMGISEAVAEIVCPWGGQRFGSDDPGYIERAATVYGESIARVYVLL